ncbi:MAG: hypothetical protein HY283_02480 [Nitrospirae bacterium]|nr:hypothetical protein [Nitrospirota bacterium]
MTRFVESIILFFVLLNIVRGLFLVIFCSARRLLRTRPDRLCANVGLFLLGFFLFGCNGESNFVTAIAINPEHSSILFIATNDSIYKTHDDGATWIPVTEGLGHARIVSLAVHPFNTSTIFAGTLGDAVYRSVDGGNRWSIVNAGMKEHVTYVNTFVFHPNNPETVLAGTTVGLFKTVNDGMMWDEMSSKGMDSVYVVSAALDPADTNILYAGTSGGVYKSINGGMAWREANNGMIHVAPGTALSLGVNSLAMDPSKTTTLYAGTTRGVFKTTDGAVSWTKLQEGIGERFVATVLIHPTVNMTLFAGTQNGVYKTNDGGEHWTGLNNGLSNLSIRSLAMNPKDPGVLYAGTQGGLFKTTDGGAHWTALTFRPKK